MKIGLTTYLGMKVTAVLPELLILRDAKTYDYFLVGHQSWFLAPSVPANSFLDGDMSAVLFGKQLLKNKLLALLPANGG